MISELQPFVGYRKASALSLRIKTELWQQKSAFLLLTQFAVFSIALFYLCRAIFPIDFSGIDALFGGFDTGILWATGSLLFIGLLKAREDIAGKIVYIGLPAAFFLLFSLLIHGFASMGSSMRSIGSSTLPLDLLIFWPSASRIRPCT